MKVTWLHVSDFHIRGGDPYDRDVVLRALVSSVKELRSDGRVPDLIFATGDVAHAGKPAEYEIATQFFDSLLEAAGLERKHLFVIPGNHDVDRDMGIGLARTLDSREVADAYFRPGIPKPHLTQKLGAFRSWFNRYFEGIRAQPEESTCGPVEALEIRGCRIGVLPLNTALFCEDEEDHAKLCVGRRCLDACLAALGDLNAHLKVALLHHPLEWLSDIERSNIKVSLQEHVQVLLRGHLHETEVENVVSANGEALHIAAGASYQTRKWPNRALYGRFEAGQISVLPIRYEDQPHEIWTVDPSLFPRETGFERLFRLKPDEVEVRPARTPEAVPLSRFRSNIPSGQNFPFVGREALITRIQETLGEPTFERVLVLHGQPGVGKSELAREYARRHRDRYPGGTFFIDAGSGSIPVDLARIGLNVLTLDFPSNLSIQDQCIQTLLAMGGGGIPVLLIYDNVPAPSSIQPWVPPAGMLCHVLVTTVLDHWGPGWCTIEVDPLSSLQSIRLIEELAGREVAERHGQALANLAGGLPVQICPIASTLAYETRRGRIEAIRLELADEAQESFRLVYDRLDPSVQLLLHAAAFLNGQRIPRQELYLQVKDPTGWSQEDFQRRLDACLDLHLLEGVADLRMHQLFSSFVLGTTVSSVGLLAPLERIRATQRNRFAALASQICENPADSEIALSLAVFRMKPQDWSGAQAEISIEEGETVGSALRGIGKFTEALPWFERAVEAKEQWALQDRVDHQSLGLSLHQVGFCLSSLGKFEEALPWYERAISAWQNQDLTAINDPENLGTGLYQIGYCLSSLGEFEKALPWYERAVEVSKQGDTNRIVDHLWLGIALHQVGYCLSSLGKYEEALPWYLEAVESSQRGDLGGNVNHESLGVSLRQVGFCLSNLGMVEEALLWLQRAVEASQLGDRFGRIDHESLGTSLHEVGYCLLSMGKYDEALPWFEKAAKASRQGDFHKRVDHDSVGTSLMQVANCLWNLGKLEEALRGYERAVQARREGDIFGRVDLGSLALSLKKGADCLRRLNRLVEAQDWEQEAEGLEAAPAVGKS